MSSVFRKRAGMIWSVSTFSAESRTACEVRVVKLAMSIQRQSPDVGDFAGDGGRGGGERRGEEGAAALALATFEVAVAGADRVLARGRADRRSWRCTSSSPARATRRRRRVNTRSSPSASACFLMSCEPGTTSVRTPLGDLAALHDAGGGAQIRDARVGARADEHHVDLVTEQRLARPLGPCTSWPFRRLRARRVEVAGGGQRLRDGTPMPGVRAVGDHRLERAGVDVDARVVGGAVVGR